MFAGNAAARWSASAWRPTADEETDAQRFPLGPARRAGFARLQLLDAREREAGRPGGGECPRGLERRGSARARKQEQREKHPHGRHSRTPHRNGIRQEEALRKSTIVIPAESREPM